jgi:hypothetical protein
MAAKIAQLEIENLKRVKAVALEPAQSGLTVIGGRNGQGKTSVLDAMAWALGGDRKRPSEPRRDGSVLPPSVRITLSNGLRVERAGANSALKVIDPGGNKGGQRLLDEFVHELALDLPKFMQSSPKEKAATLLGVIGVGDRLHALEAEERALYDRRTEIGRIADAKKKHAGEMPEYPDAPAEPISAGELIREQQGILARNGENQRLRERAAELGRRRAALAADAARLEGELAARRAELAEAEAALAAASKTAEQLRDESTAELEQSIAAIDETNAKARANMDRNRAADEAAEYGAQRDALTAELEGARGRKAALLDGAELPLPGLSVMDGELTYRGYKWDNMSGSDQLRIAASIVRKLNPNCGFVLMDRLEQMDLGTLREFGEWLEAEGLQAIATRVSTGGECSIIIEDGEAAGAAQETPPAAQAQPPAAQWKEGEF